MSDTVVTVFDRYIEAEKARAELIDAGFATADVYLDARDDEAGPAKGNFTVGNGHTAKDRLYLEHIKNADPAYYLNYTVSEDLHPGNYVLTVTTHSEEERRLASRIAGRPAR